LSSYALCRCPLFTNRFPETLFFSLHWYSLFHQRLKFQVIADLQYLEFFALVSRINVMNSIFLAGEGVI
jgi:hypothetical protein